MNRQQRHEVETYVRSGDAPDCRFFAWPGQNVIEKATNGERALREALVATVLERARSATRPLTRLPADPSELIRSRLDPMVAGLLPANLRILALERLVRSVIVVVPATVKRVLEDEGDLSTTWDVGNLYLASLGAELLAEDATPILGLWDGERAFVTHEYFTENGRFDDFVVHECAHALHDTKLRDLGLPRTRTRERPLEIDFKKRETFAYSCEAFSRIVVLGRTRSDRIALAEEVTRSAPPSDRTVDRHEYHDILRDAARARNGWKRILARCG